MELKCFQSSVLSKTPSDDEASAVADLVTPETGKRDTDKMQWEASLNHT